MVSYCTREDVKAATDMATTAVDDARVDRLIGASTRTIEALCHRRFYPEAATRSFDWPDNQMGRTWRLWLDANEVISVTTLSSGGAAISSDDYLLRPNSGPPYTHIEIDLSSSATFGGGATHQDDITVTGVFGAATGEEPAGFLAEVLDSSETSVDVTDSAAIGVGDLVLVDSERMQVTDKAMLTTGQTLQTPLTASKTDVIVAVSNGAAFTRGEVLLLDAERMRIVDVAGDSLVVKRAHDGTVLAAHTGSTIYAPRTLTVTRGVLGTTAATHNNAAAIGRHVVPPLVRQLAIAEAITALRQEDAAYARVAGSGENTRVVTGARLRELREDVYTAHGRKVRKRVV